MAPSSLSWLPPPSALTAGTSLLSRGSLWALCSLSLFCPRQVCFDRLGCFDSDSPWVDVVFRPHVTLPRNPAEVDVRFFLSSSLSSSSSSSSSSTLNRLEARLPTSLVGDDAAFPLIEAAGVDTASSTVFIVHGFFASAKSDWILGMKDAFLRFHGANVVRVSWDTAPPNYMKAVADARVVGAEIGLLLTRLASRLPPAEVEPFLARVHIIGHSLGAHVAGYAGNFVESQLGLKIGRITGLDPAGPAFQYTDPLVRLDPTDATFVDGIHTDAAADFITGWGMEQPVGHIDFYPNGGQNQPGCVEQQLSVDVLSITGDKFGSMIVCHHKRACYYYLETLIPRNVTVKIEEIEPKVYTVNWTEDWQQTYSVLGNLQETFDIDSIVDGSDSNADQSDHLERTLTLGGARAGAHKRGQCGFLGTICNRNLDLFGELKPECGAKCAKASASVLTFPENGTVKESTLCVPMGHEAAIMAADIKNFRERTSRQQLKMYLETNNVPPFCKS